MTFIPWLLIIRYYNPTDMSGKEILIMRDFTNILRYLDNWLVVCVIGLYADQSGDNQLKKRVEESLNWTRLIASSSLPVRGMC